MVYGISMWFPAVAAIFLSVLLVCALTPTYLAFVAGPVLDRWEPRQEDERWVDQWT